MPIRQASESLAVGQFSTTGKSRPPGRSPLLLLVGYYVCHLSVKLQMPAMA